VWEPLACLAILAAVWLTGRRVLRDGGRHEAPAPHGGWRGLAAPARLAVAVALFAALRAAGAIGAVRGREGTWPR
jgi:hypothetical protein